MQHERAPVNDYIYKCMYKKTTTRLIIYSIKIAYQIVLLSTLLLFSDCQKNVQLYK